MKEKFNAYETYIVDAGDFIIVKSLFYWQFFRDFKLNFEKGN